MNGCDEVEFLIIKSFGVKVFKRWVNYIGSLNNNEYFLLVDE